MVQPGRVSWLLLSGLKRVLGTVRSWYTLRNAGHQVGACLVHEESGRTQLVHGVGDASDVLCVVFPGCAGFLVKAGTASYRHSTGLDSARTSCECRRARQGFEVGPLP